MRLSSDNSDPGYANWQEALVSGRNPFIFLDGVEQKHCTMADDVAGVITRCVLDADDKAQIHPDIPDEIWMETVNGVVEFRYS